MRVLLASGPTEVSTGLRFPRRLPLVGDGDGGWPVQQVPCSFRKFAAVGAFGILGHGFINPFSLVARGG